MSAEPTTVTSPTEQSRDAIRKSIFSMVWPVTAENVLQMLLGFVNTAMVGRLGAATILAVGLSTRVGMFVWIIFGSIGTGATVLAARALGADDAEGIRRVCQHALFLTAILMVVIVGVIFAFAPSLLGVFKITPEALPTGIAYLRILCFSMPFQALFMVVSAILRGIGDTRTPMQIAFCTNIVNVAFNAVLIFGRLGFPAMGFRGSAVATIIGQFVGAALALAYLYQGRSKIQISLKDRFSIELPVVRRLIAIGVPASAEMMFWQMAAVVLFRLINDFGTAAGAAYQLGLQAEGISYMPTAGFGIAATALVGRSLGAKDPDLAERYVKELVQWGVILSFCATLILVLGPRYLMRILTNDEAVVSIGAGYLLIMGLSQVPAVISSTLGGSLRGAGDTMTLMVAGAIGIWGCRVPLSFVLSQRTGLGITGVWWAINADQFVRLGITGWRYFQGKWKKV